MTSPRRPPRVRPRRLSDIDLQWEERVEALQFDALDRVRATAEKWAASLAAILALFGTVLVVKGREDINALKEEWQIAVGVLLLLGLLSAAYATWEAAQAAQGTPREIHRMTGSSLRTYELHRARAAAKQLRTSRLFTWAAVVCLVLAVGCTWFGEVDPAPPESEAAEARR